MTADQAIIVATGVIQSGALGTFFWFVIRGMRSEIKGLQNTIKAQKDTLDVMERRTQETEKLGNVYRKFLEEIPEDIQHYKEFIRVTKDSTIADLQVIVESKQRALEHLSGGKAESIEASLLIKQEIIEGQPGLITAIQKTRERKRSL
jgi:hypothetical protein